MSVTSGLELHACFGYFVLSVMEIISGKFEFSFDHIDAVLVWLKIILKLCSKLSCFQHYCKQLLKNPWTFSRQ